MSGLDPEVFVQLVHVGGQCRVGDHVHDTAVLHHVVAVGHRRGKAEVLLDEQDRESRRLKAEGFPDSTEVKMILTTPFCPYAGSMIAQVKEQAESVVDHEVKVTLLAERWDPRDAGLMW